MTEVLWGVAGAVAGAFFTAWLLKEPGDGQTPDPTGGDPAVTIRHGSPPRATPAVAVLRSGPKVGRNRLVWKVARAQPGDRVWIEFETREGRRGPFPATGEAARGVYELNEAGNWQVATEPEDSFQPGDTCSGSWKYDLIYERAGERTRLDPMVVIGEEV